ncbi:hypothetical protein [Amycolatopsis viridis]|uniref:Membrane protein YphA (DoxX/SURF4 family) n=1 Tax=Amycolatopsis viridis TaxID=185678 RepID=A0ABX0SVP4_9PSEU|nr:hypothetical protein [Amycolatopsis viridis]NIH80484.1 putative membrane protein YphA (DoxX/SURF4 family) [Amycolatopsis viridis]
MRRKRRAQWVRIEPWHIPVRLVTGAFILNSGLTKQTADETGATQLHGFAAGAYPPVKQIPPQRFVQMLSAGEITLGAALLIPAVPPLVAGAGLAAFSAGLLGLYARTPGMRKERSVRPTEQGTGLAKDVWMFGIGTALVLDHFLGAHRR